MFSLFVREKRELMNRSLSFLMTVLFINAALGFQAWATGVSIDSRSEDTLEQLDHLARACVVRPYVVNASGRTEYLPLRSICREIEVVNPSKARVVLSGRVVTVVIAESDHADGGDLNDVTVVNDRGRVLARMTAIPAFNDVLLALTGGREVFRRIQERQ